MSSLETPQPNSAHPSLDGSNDEIAASADTHEEEGPVPLARVVPGCLLAWAVPGLGHVFLGRVGRGALFGLVVLMLFVGGIALEGKVYRPVTGEPLSYLAAVGAAGVGAPYLVAHSAGFGEGDIEGPTFDYGNTFTLVAGLLNLLIVLDAYDCASGRR